MTKFNSTKFKSSSNKPLRFTREQSILLEANREKLLADPDTDLVPVVRILHRVYDDLISVVVAFSPDLPNKAHGFTFFGAGVAQYGVIDLAALARMPRPMGECFRVDQDWVPKARMSTYIRNWVQTKELDLDIPECDSAIDRAPADPFGLADPLSPLNTYAAFTLPESSKALKGARR